MWNFLLDKNLKISKNEKSYFQDGRFYYNARATLSTRSVSPRFSMRCVVHYPLQICLSVRLCSFSVPRLYKLGTQIIIPCFRYNPPSIGLILFTWVFKKIIVISSVYYPKCMRFLSKMHSLTASQKCSIGTWLRLNHLLNSTPTRISRHHNPVEIIYIFLWIMDGRFGIKIVWFFSYFWFIL